MDQQDIFYFVTSLSNFPPIFDTSELRYNKDSNSFEGIPTGWTVSIPTYDLETQRLWSATIVGTGNRNPPFFQSIGVLQVTHNLNQSIASQSTAESFSDKNDVIGSTGVTGTEEKRFVFNSELDNDLFSLAGITDKISIKTAGTYFVNVEAELTPSSNSAGTATVTVKAVGGEVLSRDTFETESTDAITIRTMSDFVIHQGEKIEISIQSSGIIYTLDSASAKLSRLVYLRDLSAGRSADLITDVRSFEMNSYVGRKDLLDYARVRRYSEAVVNYTPTETDDALVSSLRQAFVILNALDYCGEKSDVNPNRALMWPREEVEDRNGNEYAEDEIPSELKCAQMEIAIDLMNRDVLEDQAETTGGIGSLGGAGGSISFDGSTRGVISFQTRRLIDHLVKSRFPTQTTGWRNEFL